MEFQNTIKWVFWTLCMLCEIIIALQQSNILLQFESWSYIFLCELYRYEAKYPLAVHDN